MEFSWGLALGVPLGRTRDGGEYGIFWGTVKSAIAAAR